jgi:PDZ domain/Aspartyl protease
MRAFFAGCLLVFICGSAFAQDKAQPTAPVTVPAAIDHNRVVINADLILPNGSAETVRAWVDNGNPDLYISRRLATLLNLAVTCGNQECSSPPPKELVIGGMTIPLSQVKEAKIPLKPISVAAVLVPGMAVEMNIPASLLRSYDVLINFPEHRFSIGVPGTIHFRGSSEKVRVTGNGLIQVPSQIENKKYNLALDVGSSISLLSEELFDKLAAGHLDWPRMTGAVGSANMWGAEAETNWKVMRVDRVQFGPLFLTDVPFVAASKATMDFFEKRAGMPTIGLLGSDMLLGYRVGLDYAHSTVYFDIGKMTRFPEFDVIGLVLRPEDDGRFTILKVADLDGKPSVAGVQAGDELVAVDNIPVHGSTMGQVWAMLGGTPGQERKLTIERAGKEFVVPAKVQHFLGALPEEDRKKKKK